MAEMGQETKARDVFLGHSLAGPLKSVHYQLAKPGLICPQAQREVTGRMARKVLRVYSARLCQETCQALRRASRQGKGTHLADGETEAQGVRRQGS